MPDATTALQEFKATVTPNLLAPDDFIDWNAVTTAVEASSEAARRLDALRSANAPDAHALADALEAYPALYDVALGLVAFNTSGSQVTKWGLPAEVPTDSQGRLRTAEQLLYVGLDRVLAGSAPAIDLLRVAEVYRDSFRRRFRSGTRHIQFKSVMVDGKAARTSVSLKLAAKPSGCVIWFVVTPELAMHSFLWFGGAPGQPLPDVSDFQVTKHSKGNADGVKLERPGHRIVPRGKFDVLPTLDAVLERLFGPLP